MNEMIHTAVTKLVVVSRDRVFVWLAMPLIFQQADYAPEEFWADLGSGDFTRRHRALNLVQTILFAVEDQWEKFGPGLHLGKLMPDDSVHRLGFAGHGDYVLGTIRAKKIETV